MNQTIISMLKCLLEHYKSNWRNHVNKLVHAYNSTKSSATGYSPYYLLFGRHPRLSIDLLLPSQSNRTTLYPDYAKKWEDQMRQAYQIVKNYSETRKKRDINRHNTKVSRLNILKPEVSRSGSRTAATSKMEHFVIIVNVVINWVVINLSE